MTADLVIQVFREVLMLSIKLAGPLLIISMIVGLFIAVFQAATQINEQTLTFVPKALTITVLLLLLAPNMIASLTGFLENIFTIITRISQHTTAF
ncbi:MAG: flagellar biosynthetic protein FliQ [Oscillospiraceae bacterium]|nr:flagellar biosynthetic protein FliQ [Oscillospiraceae bacterium]